MSNDFCTSLIGLSKDDAFSVIEKRHMRARITRINGTPLIVTKDMRANRVNLHIENNKVTQASIG